MTVSKTFAVIAGTRRFDGSIECQQIFAMFKFLAIQKQEALCL